MQQLKRILTNYSLLVVSIATVGFYTFLVISSMTELKFESKIDILDLFSLSITLLAASFIATVLEKRKSDSRAFKDFHIQRLNEILVIIFELENRLTEDSVLYKTMMSGNRQLKQLLTSYAGNLLGAKSLFDKKCSKKIDKIVTQFRLPINDISDTVKLGGRIVDGVIQINDAYRINTSIILRTQRILILDLILIINEA